MRFSALAAMCVSVVWLSMWELTGTSPVNAVYAVKIPAGTAVYIGPVGNQGGIYVGGSNINQIFVPQPWKIPGVEVIGPPSSLP
jgi:hypothetical protein